MKKVNRNNISFIYIYTQFKDAKYDFQCVSTALGTGKTKYINKEEALLQKDIEQADFDMLLVNLRMDAVFVKENMRIRWSSETGIVESIAGIVKEYKETRGLNVCIFLAIYLVADLFMASSNIFKFACSHYAPLYWDLQLPEKLL